MRKLIVFLGWIIASQIWIVSLIFLLTGNFLSGLFLLAFGFLLTPLFSNFIKKKFNWLLPLLVKIVLGILLIIGASVAISSEEEIAETPTTNKTKDVETIENNISKELEIEDNTDETVYYEVASITDGDTIKVLINNQTQIVRIVNINTPESVDPRKPVECMGKGASEQMTKLLYGKKVALELDETQTDRDKFDRLLRFVFLEDGTDVGLEMIKLGFAQSTPYGNVPHKYLDLYEKTQKEAMEKELGLWNPLACLEPSPEPTTKPTSIPTNTPSPTKQPAPSNQVPKTNTKQQQIVAPTTSQPKSGGVVKKSRNNICHAPGTTYYDRTKNFTAFNTLEECLASGGRLPKK